MRKKWLLVVGIAVLAISIFWSIKPKSAPPLTLADLLQYRMDADREPAKVDKQLDALLAYAAFATEAGTYLRAVRSARRLMKNEPEFGAGADVKESLRQLVEEMNRYLRLRGVENEIVLVERMKFGLDLESKVLGRRDLTKNQRIACLTAVARICLVCDKPDRALSLATEAVQLDSLAIPARFAIVDALADAGRYRDAVTALLAAARVVDRWADTAPRTDIKIYAFDRETLALPVESPQWVGYKGKIVAQLRGQIATQAQVLTGLSRLQSSSDSP